MSQAITFQEYADKRVLEKNNPFKFMYRGGNASWSQGENAYNVKEGSRSVLGVSVSADSLSGYIGLIVKPLCEVTFELYTENVGSLGGINLFGSALTEDDKIKYGITTSDLGRKMRFTMRERNFLWYTADAVNELQPAAQVMFNSWESNVQGYSGYNIGANRNVSIILSLTADDGTVKILSWPDLDDSGYLKLIDVNINYGEYYGPNDSGESEVQDRPPIIPPPFPPNDIIYWKTKDGNSWFYEIEGPEGPYTIYFNGKVLGTAPTEEIAIDELRKHYSGFSDPSNGGGSGTFDINPMYVFVGFVAIFGVLVLLKPKGK